MNNDELVNDDGSSSDTVRLKKDNNTADNVDPVEALKALPNLKKYKINQLCTQNLTKLGWHLLGDNVSEERCWTHGMMKREIPQIDEAVQYHMSNQNKLLVNRIVMASIVKLKMSW